MSDQKKLYIIPTPIGNIQDITYRAIEILKEVDLIFCEDTRITGKLLKYYQIQTPMKPYNAFIERKENIEKTLDYYWEKYHHIALSSDAGTPCISDPGFRLVHYCHQRNIPTIPLPGASALTTALSACGFSLNTFLFYGFLPNKKNKRKNILEKKLLEEKKILVFYESPYRLLHFFEILNELKPNISVSLFKELTKKFETHHRGLASNIFSLLKTLTAIKGEYVIVLDNRPTKKNE